jgi:phage terminase large subunit-like protein
LLPHTKGKWAAKREKIQLGDWQCFLIVVTFGWINRAGTRAGKRRFTTVYWEIPRKNGKSILAAGVGLYMLTADGEYGGEVYCGATTEKQAWEVFKPARLMMERSPTFAVKLGVTVLAKSLVIDTEGAKFEPVIGTPGDGPSPSCAIVDEFHEHATPAMRDSFETGMGAREQPLLMLITTAGTNIAGPCHETHDEARKTLEGSLERPDLFACVFGIDEGDDWADPKVLVKANPNYGISVDADFLRTQQRNALASPAQQAKFKTKHLNVWSSVLNGMFNMQDWSKCADRTLDEDLLINDSAAESYGALDLASKIDLSTLQRLYRRLEADRWHYYLFGRYWLPEETLNEEGPNKADYAKWVLKGWLIPTDGATVDFELITEETLQWCREANPLEVVYDPFNATQLGQALQKEGVEVVEFVQNPQNFGVPVDDLAAAMKDGRFHHDGNEVTTWCMSNVVARPTRKGLFSPIKAKPHQKIDGAIAAIMAMARASVAEDSSLDGYFSNIIVA